MDTIVECVAGDKTQPSGPTRLSSNLGRCDSLSRCVFGSFEISRLECLVCSVGTVKQYNMLRS